MKFFDNNDVQLLSLHRIFVVYKARYIYISLSLSVCQASADLVTENYLFFNCFHRWINLLVAMLLCHCEKIKCSLTSSTSLTVRSLHNQRSGWKTAKNLSLLFADWLFPCHLRRSYSWTSLEDCLSAKSVDVRSDSGRCWRWQKGPDKRKCAAHTHYIPSCSLSYIIFAHTILSFWEVKGSNQPSNKEAFKGLPCTALCR